jgi:gliding motility-associated-like protein
MSNTKLGKSWGLSEFYEAIIPVVAGNNVVVCEGESVTLTASGAASYSWNNGINNGIAFVPSLGTTTYTVSGTSSAGCINTDQVDVTVNPNPEVAFIPGITLGCAPLETTFTNLTTDAVNCVWTFSNGTVITGCGTVPVTFSQSGCYDATLTTTSTNGCSSSFTATNVVCAEEAPNAAFTPSSNNVSNFNTLIDFTNQTTGASNYVWSFGDNSGISTEVNPSHLYPNDIEAEYMVTLIAYSPLGCVDTAYSFIQIYEELIFYVPNTFTPDIDNYNPVFQPVFTAGFDPFSYNLMIFNRWGEIVFESNNAEIGWNGSYGNNGQIEMCQDGVYTWKIEFKVSRWDERRQVFGHVNLIR